MPQYPFGLDGAFAEMDMRDPSGKAVVRYKPNPKQLFAHNCMADEVFYGGAVGGGKSWFLLWHNAMHCMKYGKYANTVMFRRSFDELAGSLVLEQMEMFHNPKYIGTYKAGNFVFEWINGARTWFRHLQDEGALLKHRSRQYTLVCFDELTDFHENEYTFLFQRLRSPKDPNIFPQMISGSNPRGVGHRWVYERFIKGLEPMNLYGHEIPAYKFGGYEYPGRTYKRVFVPARLDDNIEMLANDPEYPGRMKLSLSEDMYKAYVEGNWEYFEGMAFPEWDPAVHVCKPFPIPSTWKVIRSLDWGYSSPFSVGWWAQDPDTKTIYRIDEWYGARKGPKGGVGGLSMAVTEARDNLRTRERVNVRAHKYPKPRYGVADGSMWQRRGASKSEGDLWNENGILFLEGNRDRPVGKQIFHNLLRMNPDTGKPGVIYFNTCTDAIRTMPMLVLDDKNMEEVDTNQEDHIYDEARYALVALTEAPAHRQESAADRKAARKASRLPVLI